MSWIPNKDNFDALGCFLEWTVLLEYPNMSEEVFEKLVPEFAIRESGSCKFKMSFCHDHIFSVKIPVKLLKRDDQFVVFQFSTFVPYHSIKEELKNYIKTKAGLQNFKLHFQASTTLSICTNVEQTK